MVYSNCLTFDCLGFAYRLNFVKMLRKTNILNYKTATTDYELLSFDKRYLFLT